VAGDSDTEDEDEFCQSSSNGVQAAFSLLPLPPKTSLKIIVDLLTKRCQPPVHIVKRKSKKLDPGVLLRTNSLNQNMILLPREYP
jgi:hypothetical protein